MKMAKIWPLIWSEVGLEANFSFLLMLLENVPLRGSQLNWRVRLCNVDNFYDEIVAPAAQMILNINLRSTADNFKYHDDTED